MTWLRLLVQLLILLIVSPLIGLGAIAYVGRIAFRVGGFYGERGVAWWQRLS